MVKILKSDVKLELFSLERFPHPDKCSYEIDRSFANLSLKISIFSIGMLHWVGREGHMNTYQGGRTSQGKLIPIKRHFASSIFGTIFPLFGSTPLINIHVRFRSTNWYIYETTYILETPILSIQYIKMCIKLQV